MFVYRPEHIETRLRLENAVIPTSTFLAIPIAAAKCRCQIPVKLLREATRSVKLSMLGERVNYIVVLQVTHIAAGQYSGNPVLSQTVLDRHVIR